MVPLDHRRKLLRADRAQRWHLARSDGRRSAGRGRRRRNWQAVPTNAAQLSDDGSAIPSYYTTHYFPERAVEQSLNLGAHRKLFSYLTMYVEGAGSLALTSFTNSASVPQAQQALPLSSPAVKDLELPINVLGERVAFKVSTNQSGAWFRLQKFTPSLRVDPWSPVRGLN